VPTENLRIELLGPVRGWWANEELDLGSTRSRAVLALLAIRVGKTVSRHEIITGLWGADAPDTAEASLESDVAGLRQVLDSAPTRQSGGLLVSVEDGYCLRVDPDVVDVTTFARLRKRASIHAELGEFRAAVGSLTTALALWSGEALADVSGPFTDVHRARLGEWRIAARERRAEVMLALGGHLEVIAELTELVNAHPLRERLRSLLMLAQYRAGLPTDAIEGYRSAQLLAEKLGMQPGRALRRLNDRIVASDPSLDLAAAVRRAPLFVSSRRPAIPAPDTSAPFAGRHRELAVLDSRLRALAAGRGGAVWIEGNAGIGKTRLLTVGLSASVASEVRLVSGAADELSGRFRLRVMADALRLDPTAVYPWRDATPVVGAVERLSAAIDRLCTDGPVAIAVDDLHRIDCASLMLWHRLVQITARQPLLLIGTSRPLPRRAVVDWVRDEVTAVGGDLLQLDAESPLYLRDVVEAETRAHSYWPDRASTNVSRVTTAV
jgi:DNA-binding SARP family transcriptional activator